jgi:mono/diheme cytochrome c family protein
MMKSNTSILLVCVVFLGFALTGCGSVPSSTSPTPSTAVGGVASLGTTTNVTVSLKDSSVPAKEITTTPRSNGTYVVDVKGLTPPYLLKAAGRNNAGTTQLYSLSTKGGWANINSLSDTAVAAAADGTSPDELYTRSDPERNRRTAYNLEAVINSLRTVLAPLFALYQTSDPITDNDDHGENSGLRAMLRDVRVTVVSGMVTVTNRQTGGVIFSGPLKNLDTGTFHPENMPGGPGTIPGTTSGATLYAENCSTCHGTLATSSMKGKTADQIQAAIAGNRGGMGSLSTLTTDQISAIAAALATTTTPPPAACTYTYDGWGVCQSNGIQIRGLLSSSPAGCTGGTPVLTQSCTYVPPTAVCGSCHAIPPATGRHTTHYPSRATCITCHGAGYSPNGVTAATHQNGAINIAATPGWNATSRTCSNACHGTKAW